MFNYPLGEQNKAKQYVDEKELYILFVLLKKGHISNWDEPFSPTDEKSFIITEEMSNDTKIFEKEATDRLHSVKARLSSPTIANYFLELGKVLDEKRFSIYYDADYALEEGGFLSEYIGDVVDEYLADTKENRKKAEKYKILNREQKDFLKNIIKTKYIDRIEFSEFQHPPIEIYREAILNKKADKDFIDLVNKLIKNRDEGNWNRDDLKKFIEIYYKHNKKYFKNTVGNPKDEIAWLRDDAQTKLSKLIFEHALMILRVENTEKLKRDINKYVDLFIADELKNWSKNGLTHGFFRGYSEVPKERVMFGFERQKEILLGHIKNEYDQYKRRDLEIGSPFFEPEYIGDERKDEVKTTLSEVDRNKERFLFVHTILALEKSGYLDITGFSYGTTEMFDMYDRGFLFHITLKDKFFGRSEEEVSAKTGFAVESQPKAIIKLCLESSGDLWREPKKKYCYPLGNGSGRYRVIQHLVVNKGYQQTSSISSIFEKKSLESIRKEIGEINDNFEKFIKIKTGKFIEGRKGSGYRVNPKYKISLKQQ